MRFMYTTTPDPEAREIAKGVYMKAVHTYQQQELLKQGWTYTPILTAPDKTPQLELDLTLDQEADNHGMQHEEKRQENPIREVTTKEADPEAEFYIQRFTELFDRAPPPRLKLATIKKKVLDYESQQAAVSG